MMKAEPWQDAILVHFTPKREQLLVVIDPDNLLQDDALRRRLGQQAWSWAQNYSWAKIGDRVTEVYQLAQHVQSVCVCA